MTAARERGHTALRRCRYAAEGCFSGIDAGIGTDEAAAGSRRACRRFDFGRRFAPSFRRAKRAGAATAGPAGVTGAAAPPGNGRQLPIVCHPRDRTLTTELGELFDTNRQWAEGIERRTPGFFTRLQNQQAPQYLWIGCADSRVPANDIVGLLPGELFVHRNVANVVVHSDLNCLSVIQFAIDLLKVQHIIVVGHYGCSGVRAALEDLRIGLADNWLRHVQDVRNKHRVFIESLPDDGTRLRALCELNVLEQAASVCETTVVRDAWARKQKVVVHGWIYGLHNGLLEDLRMTVHDSASVGAAYGLALGALKDRYTGRRPPLHQG
jgi:carbonic anhydrase